MGRASSAGPETLLREAQPCTRLELPQQLRLFATLKSYENVDNKSAKAKSPVRVNRKKMSNIFQYHVQQEGAWIDAEKPGKRWRTSWSYNFKNWASGNFRWKPFFMTLHFLDRKSPLFGGKKHGPQLTRLTTSLHHISLSSLSMHPPPPRAGASRKMQLVPSPALV